MVSKINLLRQHLLGFLVVAATSLPLSAWAETRLLMAEEVGCMWCAEWNKTIAPIYPKTPEGKAAPLFRININDQNAEGLTFVSKLRFTPTFVLMQDGQEIARIEGYPGEDFFWGLLQVMLDNAGVDYKKAENS